MARNNIIQPVNQIRTLEHDVYRSFKEGADRKIFPFVQLPDIVFTAYKITKTGTIRFTKIRNITTIYEIELFL